MQLAATYTNPDDQELALTALRKGGIPFEVRRGEDEAGMELTGIYVPEEHFDRACDIIERLESLLAGERQQARKLACPSCGAELDACDEIDFGGSVTGITSVLKCRGCGRLIPR